MTAYPSSFAQMKSIDQFPEYPSQRQVAPMEALKPTYPIEHRSRRKTSS